MDRLDYTKGLPRRLLAIERLLERRTAEDDARRAVLSLTPRGKKLDVTTPGTIEAAMESVLETMSVDDIVVVERFLSRFAEAVETQTTATKQERPRRIQRRGA